MDNQHTAESVHQDVMEAIHAGRARMRPRWHFLAWSVCFLSATLIIFIVLLFVASLAIFVLRDTGAWFAPSFGSRGWYEFFRALPWFLILLLIACVGLLENLMRRYAFVYRRPLLASIGSIFGLILVGGLLLPLTPFHHQMYLSARKGELPGPLGMWYMGPFRSARLPDMKRGTILESINGGFILADSEDGATSTVLITKSTRLPYGEDFSVGTLVVVIGDRIATDTIRAFGIREVRD